MSLSRFRLTMPNYSCADALKRAAERNVRVVQSNVRRLMTSGG